MKKPYLLQRCKSKDFEPGMKTGDFLTLDYMGSSEFEWGAVPKFQREIHRIQDELQIFGAQVGTHFFYVLAKDRKEASEYELHLNSVLNRSLEVRLKEPAYLEKPEYDVWLDLKNLTIIARDMGVLLHLKETVKNSVKFMDAQKGSK